MSVVAGKFLDPSMFQTDTATGNGVATGYVLSQTPRDGDSIYVSINGLIQELTTDYTVNVGTKTVSFVTAPATAQDIIFQYIKV